jgi:hypothetical protein
MQIYLCFDIYLNFSTSSFLSNSDYWMLFGLLFKVCYMDAFYASWFQNFVKSILSPQNHVTLRKAVGYGEQKITSGVA